MPFLVIQPKELERSVVAIANVRVTESSFAALKALSEAERDEFLWNLKRELYVRASKFFL